jgi:hypothetical protein
MSDLVVLIAIVWACVMTGVAFHYYRAYDNSLKGGAKILHMLIGIALGDATIKKNADGSIVFESDEHTMVMRKGEE